MRIKHLLVHLQVGIHKKITIRLTRDQDIQYVHEILAGKTDSYKHIIASTKTLVTQIVYRMIAKVWYREDIIQEVYIKVYQNLHHFRNESKLSTWVAKVAYNYCLNELKSRRMNMLEPDSLLMHIKDTNSDPLKLVMQTDINEKVQIEIDQLPPVYKLIIGLYHQEELSIEEIQKITGIVTGTIKNYLFRARALLAKQLIEKYNKTELKT